MFHAEDGPYQYISGRETTLEDLETTKEEVEGGMRKLQVRKALGICSVRHEML